MTPQQNKHAKSLITLKSLILDSFNLLVNQKDKKAVKQTGFTQLFIFLVPLSKKSEGQKQLWSDCFQSKLTPCFKLTEGKIKTQAVLAVTLGLYSLKCW